MSQLVPINARPEPSRRRIYAVLAAVLLALMVVIVVRIQSADAAQVTSNGWTTSASVTPTAVPAGTSVAMSVGVRASRKSVVLVDVEVYAGTTRVYQRTWDQQSFSSRRTRIYNLSWTVPAGEPGVTHVVKVGVFRRGWTGLLHWNDSAATFLVTTSTATTPTTTLATTSTTTTLAPPTTASTTTSTSSTTTTTTLAPTTTASTTTTSSTTTTVKPTTTTSTSTTTTTTAPPTSTSVPSTAHFSTLPPGSALPSDATCASKVRPMPERRAINTVANHTVGTNSQVLRVTGNFTGTTDEIIEWTACKWGVDEDVVRAQIAKESWWHQDSAGDMTTDQNSCYPTFRTTSGPCPESIGLGQVRYQYHTAAFFEGNAVKSSAYNLDYTYSVWRGCYNGEYTWLNTVDRGATYAAGDLWGCVGVWFSGRWHTAPAETYIAAVKDYLSQRIWETPNFQGG